MAPHGLWAQTSSPVVGGQRKLLLFVDQQKSAGLADDQLLVLSRSLLVSLQAGVRGLSVSDSVGSMKQGSETGISDLAMKAGADFWLWAQLSFDAGKTRVRARGFDVRTQEAKFDTTVSREGALSTAQLPFERWDDISALVSAAFSADLTDAQSLEGPPEVTLTVRALPGTLVTGPGKTGVTAGKDGFAVMKLPGPGEYSVRSTLSGYYPETSRLVLSSDKEIFLTQMRASWWTIDASLLQMGYPSFDLGRFIVPNSIYVKLGFTTYAIGLAFTDTQMVTNNPLTNIVLQAGMYLRPEDVLFRAYVNVGAFLRFVYAPGTLVGVDPLSWGGLQLSIGTEIGRSPRGRFFLEYQPMFYAASVPGLFQAALGNSDPAGWTFSPTSAFNFLCFRAGYRWTL
jgi:hypothetical protein